MFHPAELGRHLGAASARGARTPLRFEGEGGELEIRPDARTALTGLRHGEPAEGVLSAAMGRQTPPGEVSVAPLQALWRGQADDA